MNVKFRPGYLLLFYVIFIVSGCRDNTSTTLFKQLDPSHTGILFNNIITETDSVNPLDVTNIYNGGGVGIGDFNNDGLQDIYLTGNQVSNKLYLNKGDFKFRDVTDAAGVSGDGKWSRGVAVVDINNDGLSDIYVCATLSGNAAHRANMLYINQGNNKDGIPVFSEQAKAYQLDDTTHSTMAAFFDYDNDGDLDVYIVVNEIREEINPSTFRPKITDGSFFSTGRLYRNDFSNEKQHPVFTDVTIAAGVTTEGYGHGVSIADFNQDGFKDIFVTNDFLSNDLLYINNRNGTFTDKAADYFKHTSANGMGQDVIDINNDGLADVIELDMNPEDNFRKKMMMGPNSYQMYQNSDHFGYQYQYVRNTLQLNRGPRVENDSLGDPVFSDIAFMAGIAETDWSWTPLVQDFDNDGFRDIIITNGFPKDVTDHDFIAFRKQSFSVASKEFTLSQIPRVKIHNYGYKNNGNLTFSNTTVAWGLETPSFSSGAAYADLDNDGDLDVVINNINDPAFIYRNTQPKNDSTHFIRFVLNGTQRNKQGIGANISIHYGNQQQAYEYNPYRGYLSSVQLPCHFGLGNSTHIDSVKVEWPGGLMQILTNVPADSTIVLDIKNAVQLTAQSQESTNRLFKEITRKVGINWQHTENDYIDFNIQKLLPHKFSEYGPALAAADIDGNGFDDLVAGGPVGKSAVLFLQQPDGSFIQRELLPGVTGAAKQWEDLGLVLFDADNDGDQDLYTASGGSEHPVGSNGYRDHFYINTGKGVFREDTSSIPMNLTSKSCVRAGDFDNDGDLDLFLGGRVEPGAYPKPVSSFLYRNDSKNGKIAFTDVSANAAPMLKNIGLVCDAIWTDFNNDGWTDILLSGEWMPVTFLLNEKGVFRNITAETGIAAHTGWWNSLVPGDFDNDGDMDYVAGNLGQNSFYRATAEKPVRIYAKDFDNNGSFDAVPTLYLPNSNDQPGDDEYVAHTRDDMVKQMIGFRSKFQNYKSYAGSNLKAMFNDAELKDAIILTANDFRHAFIRNNGNNKFSIEPIPGEIQFSCINGMLANDFDEDGNLDLLINGNDFGTEVSVGRYDACNGLLLKGNGNGSFEPVSMQKSGIFIPGNGKALVQLVNNNGNYLIAASQNRGTLKIYQPAVQTKIIFINPDDRYALITLKNGRIRRHEFNYGSSFLSQSSRILAVPESTPVTIVDAKGQRRNAE